MARSYPEHPSFPEDGGAEQRVWEALCEHLPDDAVVLAGTLLQDGAIEREIDLLVVWPGLGVAAIEVKGGHVTRADGQWWQGSGEHRHAIDPVGQVQSAKHTLLRLLDRQGLAAARTRTAHLVALPHVYVPASWDAPELPRTMLLDRDAVTDGPAAVHVIRRAIEDHGTGHAPLDEVAAEALVGWLTGGFPSQAEALADAAQYEDHLDRLTREQAHAMRYLDALPRVHVVGGAGTGKTWLALEHARRRARAGDRVALMCYSRGLARYLERATATWPARERPAYVGLFHELPVRWGAAPGDDKDPTDWEERLPCELGDLAAQRPADELFDAVVVDEAQDFGDAWWPALLRCLRDPDASRLAVFSDDGQRVFPRSGTAPVELTVITLDENLRSTKQIAQLCGALHTGITRPRGWVGAPVRVVDVPGVLGRLLRRAGRVLRARARVQGARADRGRAGRERGPGRGACADDALHGAVTGAGAARRRRASRVRGGGGGRRCGSVWTMRSCGRSDCRTRGRRTRVDSVRTSCAAVAIASRVWPRVSS